MDANAKDFASNDYFSRKTKRCRCRVQANQNTHRAKWLSSKAAKVELIPLKNNQQAGRYLDLKVSIQYDEWGYDDILNFRLPADVQKQIEGEKSNFSIG